RARAPRPTRAPGRRRARASGRGRRDAGARSTAPTAAAVVGRAPAPEALERPFHLVDPRLALAVALGVAPLVRRDIHDGRVRGRGGPGRDRLRRRGRLGRRVRRREDIDATVLGRGCGRGTATLARFARGGRGSIATPAAAEAPRAIRPGALRSRVRQRSARGGLGLRRALLPLGQRRALDRLVREGWLLGRDEARLASGLR